MKDKCATRYCGSSSNCEENSERLEAFRARARAVAHDQSRAKLRETVLEKNKPQQPVYLGRKVDQSAALELKDAQGRDRMVMRVAGDGVASLQFLDEQGKVIGQFPKEGR
jgi:hypothetical protein